MLGLGVSRPFRGKSLLWSRGEPQGDVAPVGVSVFGGLGIFDDGVAGRFADKRRAALAGVEVVVQEVVEAGIDQRPSLAIRLESDCDIKRSTGQFALAGRDDARTHGFPRGNGDRTFVGM